MAVVYVDYYNKHGEEKTHQFVFGSQVALSVLNSLYERFVKEGIEELEKLDKAKKEKYWNIGCKYYSTLGDRKKACKAVYVLELITSNE